MFKFTIVILAIIACVAAKPAFIGAPAPLTYTVPPAAVVAAPAPFVTATSSQVVARNYNGIVTAPVAAPVVARSIVAAPVAAAYTAPIVARTFATAPLAYSTPLSYSAHLTYAAAPAPVVW